MDIRKWITEVEKFLLEPYDNTFINRIKRKIKRKLLLSMNITYTKKDESRLIDWLYYIINTYHSYNSYFLLFLTKKYPHMIRFSTKTAKIESESPILSSSMNIFSITMQVPGQKMINFQWNSIDKEVEIKEDVYNMGVVNKDTIDQKVNTLIFPRLVVFFKELLKDFSFTEKNLSDIYVDDIRCFSFLIQTTGDSEYWIKMDTPLMNSHVKHATEPNTYTDVFKIEANLPIEIDGNDYYFNAKIGLTITYTNTKGNKDDSSNPYAINIVRKMVDEYETKHSGYIYGLVMNSAIDLINVKNVKRKGSVVVHE